MKWMATLFALAALSIFPASLSAEVSGDVLELHSLELFTGGCTASAEAASGGRCLLRVWNIRDGRENGVDLSGLQVAVLQTADSNQIHAEVVPSKITVYLPAKATATQREMLQQWVLRQDSTFAGLNPALHTVPILFERKNAVVKLAIGSGIKLETADLGKCETGACGQQLWYEPRSSVAKFDVLFNRRSSIQEKSLNLVWNDHGRPTVFLGQFNL